MRMKLFMTLPLSVCMSFTAMASPHAVPNKYEAAAELAGCKTDAAFAPQTPSAINDLHAMLTERVFTLKEKYEHAQAVLVEATPYYWRACERYAAPQSLPNYVFKSEDLCNYTRGYRRIV